MKRFIALVFFTSALSARAQDTNALTLTDDAKYYDFWKGKWSLLKDDGTLDTTTYFKVKASVHPAAFEEEWKFGTGMRSVALRAWDKTNNKWGFVWVSDNGLFQVWDSRKVDGQWYIYRQFSINGDTYMSRQSFILQSDGTVIRKSEKSYDEKKWELRFSQRLKRVAE